MKSFVCFDRDSVACVANMSNGLCTKSTTNKNAIAKEEQQLKLSFSTSNRVDRSSRLVIHESLNFLDPLSQFFDV